MHCIWLQIWLTTYTAAQAHVECLLAHPGAVHLHYKGFTKSQHAFAAQAIFLFAPEGAKQDRGRPRPFSDSPASPAKRARPDNTDDTDQAAENDAEHAAGRASSNSTPRQHEQCEEAAQLSSSMWRT